MSSNNKIKPEWYVFIENFNRKQIEIYNIFENSNFMKDCDDAWNEYKNDFSKFEKSVNRSLMYYFCCKCEWEVIISSFPPSKTFNEAKIDVYKQVSINWKRFINYIWNFYISDSQK